MTLSCFKCLFAGILGAAILFCWGYVSWMVLPWHNMTLKTFKDDAAVVQVIKENVNGSGIYISPLKNNKDAEGKPMIFANVDLKGMSSDMNKPMIISFVTQLIGALLVTWLLSKTTGLKYLGRVGFVVIFATAASVVSELPAWNWMGFDTCFTVVAMADLIIGWLLAGIFIAALVKGKTVG